MVGDVGGEGGVAVAAGAIGVAVADVVVEVVQHGDGPDLALEGVTGSADGDGTALQAAGRRRADTHTVGGDGGNLPDAAVGVALQPAHRDLRATASHRMTALDTHNRAHIVRAPAADDGRRRSRSPLQEVVAGREHLRRLRRAELPRLLPLVHLPLVQLRLVTRQVRKEGRKRHRHQRRQLVRPLEFTKEVPLETSVGLVLVDSRVIVYFGTEDGVVGADLGITRVKPKQLENLRWSRSSDIIENVDI